MEDTNQGSISTTEAPDNSSRSPAEYHASKQIVEEGYDQMAPRYLDWTTSHSSPRLRYLHKLLDLLPEKSNILELGCGAGVPCTQILLAHSHNVTGNDISGKQIELAKKSCPKAHFLKGDMMTLEFEQGAFGAVVGFYSVIHLPRAEQQEILKKIGDWLVDGGYLLVNLGAKDNPGSVNEDWLGEKMYWSSFNAETNAQMLKEAGFDLIEEEVTDEKEDEKTVQFLWVLAKKRKANKMDERLACNEMQELSSDT